ncbi:hypothetical protein ACEU6F_22885, partial [Aeromonas salmonicida]|uniref:hypothetical protein n=3 Tax=Aeromonas salmonicida TaxID=645 RepID=UPI0035A691FE
FSLVLLQTCSLTIWKADLKSSSQTFVTSALETSWRKPKFILVTFLREESCTATSRAVSTTLLGVVWLSD